MIKRIIAIGSLLAGLFVLWLWDVGSHGQMKFRPYMVEDWIMLIAIIGFFGLFLILILKRQKKD